MKKKFIFLTGLTVLFSTLLVGGAFSEFTVLHKYPIKIHTWPIITKLFNKQVMINMINEEREIGNVCSDGKFYKPGYALEANDDLTLAAQRHADEMAKTGVFSHTNEDGEKGLDRITDTGYYDDCRSWGYAENISWRSNGKIDQRDVVDAWLNSPKGHCQNLMSKNVDEIGIGYAISDRGIYWVADFGKCQ